MNLLNSWEIYVILYIVFAVIFNQSYRVVAKKLKKAGALTILIGGISGLSILLISPFFEYKFPTDIRIYILLGLAIIFYTITDRLNTTVRSGMEASTFSIIKQLSTVFMISFGILFFKEPVVLTKILGAVLIIFSNILIFYKKGKFTINKYVVFAILANISISIAMFLDVSISNSFNLAIYVFITLIVPALIVLIFEKIKFSDIKNEFINTNKKVMLIVTTSWGLMIISLLKAYQLGQVTIVATLCALTVIINVIVGYIFLDERDNLLKKIIASILIIISVILIKM